MKLSNIFDEEAIDTTENARQVEITISDNISAKQLSSMLYQKGLCKDKTIMYFQIMLSKFFDFRQKVCRISKLLNYLKLQKVQSSIIAEKIIRNWEFEEKQKQLWKLESEN